MVGAGLAGLSAALHLAGRGRKVIVVERGAHPGGRVGRLDIDGYRLDTGPTVLTMPDIIDDAFAAVGESISDRLELVPVEPAYRASFADGTNLDVHSDRDEMAAEIEWFAGRRQAEGYLRLRSWLTRLYEVEFNGFIAANFDSPLSLVTPQLARLAAIGGFRRWDRMMRRFITDERLLRVFTFQALYAGVPPQRALAVYAVIAYMDTVAGVYFPRGGMRALPDALASAAADAGVEFRYNSPVSALERANGRVAAVRTDTGDRVPADAVVLTTELPDTYRLLGPHTAAAAATTAGAVGGRRASGLSRRRRRRRPPHHRFRRRMAADIPRHHRHGRLMGDPSLLVTRPTAGDTRLAPAGRDLLYILAPAPNTAVGKVDWGAAAAAIHRADGEDGHRPAAAARRRRRDPARRRSGRLGTSGHGGRHPVRLGPYVRSDRTVPACQHRPGNRQRGAGGLLDGARGRRAYRTAIRADWPPTGSPEPPVRRSRSQVVKR